MSFLSTGPFPELSLFSKQPQNPQQQPSMTTSRPKPHWEVPNPSKGMNVGLTLYNSLTQAKNEFVPVNGKQVKWYICGPTVYDAAHMGHARAYITFDILRRVLEGYFGYEILYQMNVTDVDDKIIIRGRQNHLFEEFKKNTTSIDDKLIQTFSEVWEKFVLKLRSSEAEQDAGALWEKLGKLTAQDIDARVKQDEKFKMNLDTASAMRSALDALKAKKASLSKADIDAFLDASRDVIASWLDKLHGSTLTDHKIFKDLSSFWERSFFQDMDRLNVQAPDIVTRVSEFVPAIVDYTKKIIDNGYAYEAEGSVYFDAKKFDDHEGHYYAKLKPNSAFNAQLIEEGEGSISTNLGGKKSPSDFALWKKSKSGEPEWPSPWSPGRPGWHIECSVMASHILGEKIDVHSGGIDLTFPHHDNELAQAEAYYDCSQWVNYFLHAGHLHIDGLKMSKSLKNFISIDEALQKYSARQIRLMFLQHTWYSVLDFKEDTINHAITVETTFKNFFSTVKALIRSQSNGGAIDAPSFTPVEANLLNEFSASQNRIHTALCDSVDTPAVIEELKQIISKANIYINSQKAPSAPLLAKIARYVTKILQIFGVIETPTDIGFTSASSGSDANLEEKLLPYLTALSQFRDKVRSMAREKKDPKDLLALCDTIRDDILPELGVRLEDREGEPSLVKLEDKEVLLKEKREKEQKEAEKQRKKEENAAKEAAKRLEKLEKGKVSPSQMFKEEPYTGQFTQFDEKGIPTHEVGGAEVSKSKRKKLEKEYEKQEKLHEEYLAAISQGSTSSSS